MSSLHLEEPIVTAKIAFKKVWFFVALWLGTVATYCLVYKKDDRNPLEFAVEAAAAWGAIYAVRLGVWQVRTAFRHAQMVRAVEIVNELSSIEHVNTRVRLRKETKDLANDLGPLKTKLEANNNDLEMCLARALGSFEDLSIALQLGYCDETVVYLSFCYIVVTYRKLYGNWISHLQSNDDSTMYAEFVRLSDAWKHGKSVRTNDRLKRPNGVEVELLRS